MSVVVDRCFVLNDYDGTIDSKVYDKDKCLYLKCGEGVKLFQCATILPPVVRNLSSQTMCKFWLTSKGNDDIYTILKIEEIADDNDPPEPDYMDAIEIRESLLERVNCAIHMNEEKKHQLEKIKSKLSTTIRIKNIEDAYNELNDCI
mgnify:FL=1